MAPRQVQPNAGSRSRYRNPADRAEEFAAEQRRLKDEAAERRKVSAAKAPRASRVRGKKP
jgi:hypothetical protein